jgi:predicted ATPase/DNA-binding SARP family transcriptional activator
MTRLEIRLLGPFQASLDGVAITGFESSKVRALLAVLASEAPRLQRRETLAGLLWPDWPQKSALQNLSYALADLRKNIKDKEAEPPYLLISRESIQFNPDADIWVDVRELVSKSLQPVVDLYRGEFLEGFALSGSPEFEEWVLAKREAYREIALKALNRQAESHELAEEYEQTLVCARRSLELEPWNEEAHRQVMRALSLSGQRSAALAQYEACRRVLNGELRIDPSAETVRLYEAIRDEQFHKPKKLVSENGIIEQFDTTQPDRPHHNLPRQLTRFIGREQEIGQVKGLVSDYPLVTLTGPGGVGKTRLAFQVGMGLISAFPNGVWYTDLTPLTDPTLISGAVLTALGMRTLRGEGIRPGQRATTEELATLVQFLERKTVLLILDNCEHMVDACAQFAQELLPACPGLNILATSREVLGVTGEKAFPVPSLGLPEGSSLELDILYRSDAVKLFIERAQTVDSRFKLTVQNAESVVKICRRLDGIPLALELVAVRLRVMNVAQIARRMDDIFRLLGTGSRTTLPRHQTLRAMIEWSYNLLLEPEKAVFRRLAVFSGGWSIGAAEAVCTGAGVESADILDLLSRLAEKSLFVTDEHGGDTRFHMLETIRQYAEYQLYAVEGEVENARNQHRDWFLAFAETAAPSLRTSDQIAWIEHLELEHDNLRAAFRWSLERKDGEAALRLVEALVYFWMIHNHGPEGQGWIKRSLDLADSDPSLQQSRLWARGVIGFIELFDYWKEYPKMRTKMEEALLIFRREHDLIGEGQTLRWLGMIEFSQERKEDARRLYEESLAVLQESRDDYAAASTLFSLGVLSRWSNDFPAMRTHLQKSWELYKADGDRFSQLKALNYLGWDLFDQGDLKAARVLFQELLEISESLGSPVDIANYMNWLSIIDWIEGNYQRSMEAAKKLYRVGEEINNRWIMAVSLETIAEAEWHDGDYEAGRAYTQHALEIARQASDLSQIHYCLYLLGKMALYWEDAVIARKYLEEAQSIHLSEPSAERHTIQALAHAFRLEKRFPEAKRAYLDSLKMIQQNQAYLFLAESLEGMAMLTVEEGETDRPLRLFGCAQAQRERTGFRLANIQHAEIDASLARLRECLTQVDFERLLEEGRGMTVEQAVQEAESLIS